MRTLIRLVVAAVVLAGPAAAAEPKMGPWNTFEEYDVQYKKWLEEARAEVRRLRVAHPDPDWEAGAFEGPGTPYERLRAAYRQAEAAAEGCPSMDGLMGSHVGRFFFLHDQEVPTGFELFGGVERGVPGGGPLFEDFPGLTWSLYSIEHFETSAGKFNERLKATSFRPTWCEGGARMFEYPKKGTRQSHERVEVRPFRGKYILRWTELAPDGALIREHFGYVFMKLDEKAGEPASHRAPDHECTRNR